MQFTMQITYRGVNLGLSSTTQLREFTFSFQGISVDWLSVKQRKHYAAAEGKCKVKTFDSGIQKLILQFTFNTYAYICIYSTICSALTGCGRNVDYAS